MTIEQRSDDGARPGEPPRPDLQDALGAAPLDAPLEERARSDPAAARETPSRKAQDVALVLPIIGLLLFTPPVIDALAGEGRIAGAPRIALYAFGVWAALILAAWALARRLQDPRDLPPSPGASPPDPDERG